MAPKNSKPVKNQALKELEALVAGLKSADQAEGVYQQIQDNTEVSDASKQKLQVDLQTKVNEIQQAEHDKAAASGDKAGAAKAIETGDPVQLDEKKNVIPSKRVLETEEQAGLRGRKQKPMHIPEGCVIKEMDNKELIKFQEEDGKLEAKKRRFVGVRQTKPGVFSVIVKKAVLALALLFAVQQVGFAAIANDDIANMVDFAKTAGWSVDASGDLVPAADSAMDIGASGNEVDNIYVDDVIATTMTSTDLVATQYVRLAYFSKVSRPASGATIGSMISMRGANVDDCGIAGSGTVFVVCVSDGTSWKSLNAIV